MLILGIILALLGALLITAYGNSRKKCTMRVEATVSKIAVKTLPRRGYTVDYYTPVFTYSVNGEAYTEKADLSTKDAERFKVGDRAVVFIDPERPTAMRYGSNTGFLLAGIVIAAAGLFLITIFFL